MNENDIMSILDYKNISELHKYADEVKHSLLDDKAKDEILKSIDMRLGLLQKTHLAMIEDGEIDEDMS